MIAHTPEPEKLVATAAKLCYSPASIEKVLEHMSEPKTYAFITMLMELGHESPLEHCSFTFGIECISRSTSLQLVRHRIASYSQKSQRYVNERMFGYVTPPAIEDGAELLGLYDDTMDIIQERYDTIRDKLIEKYTDAGMKQLDAEKKANEDARYVLPNACDTSIMVTMNIRSLFNFFKLRCCHRAQWEIRQLAMEMYKLCMDVAPNIFKYAGPSCVTGTCSEGKMCCGKQKEQQETFKEIRSQYNALKDYEP